MNNDLITRIEQATGPDRNLDYQLDYVRCNWPVIPAAPDEKEWAELAEADDLPPAYTASLDVAMTLVPEGYERIQQEQVRMQDGSVRCWASIDGWPVSPKRCSTPALALCAAALKARTSMEGQPHDQ